MSNVRNHWRYKRFIDQCRIFPAQLTQFFYDLPPVELEELANPELVSEQPVLADLCLPNHQSGPGHNDFVPLLKILRTRQPRLVLELGTAFGNTTANICRQCPEAKIFTVNALPDQISGDIITYALSKDDIGRVYKQEGFSDRVTQIYANTLHLDLSPYLSDRCVDLAIIDACHDTSFVLNDFYKIERYVKYGGVVLFHDTHPSMEEHLAGSYRACMALRRRGFNIRHLRGTWWGVWVCHQTNPDVYGIDR